MFTASSPCLRPAKTARFVSLRSVPRRQQSIDLAEAPDISRKMRVSLLHMGDDTTTLDIADWRLEPISGADRDVVEVIRLPPEQENSQAAWTRSSGG